MVKGNFIILFNHRRSALLRELPPATPSPSSGSHYEPIEFYGMRENEMAPGLPKERASTTAMATATGQEKRQSPRRSVSPQDWLEITSEHLSGNSSELG